MATRRYETFQNAYEELLKRNFDIVGIKGDVIVGKLVKETSCRLQEHKDLEVLVRQQGNLWTLETDDSFFCNKIYVGLIRSEIPVDWRDSRNPRAPLKKIFNISINGYADGLKSIFLKTGVINDPPSSEEDKKEIEYALRNIQLYKNTNYQIFYEGLTDEELRLFEIGR